MARTSKRLSGLNGGQGPHKRAASNDGAPVSLVKRSKTKKATPTKSQYFKDEGDHPTESEESPSADEPEASDFDGGKETSQSATEAEQDDGDEYDSEEPAPSRKKAPSAKGSTFTKGKGGELWRQGVKTGLGPGNQVVIKKPKAKPAGNTPYEDERIHPNTLDFLKDLKKNNDREWLKMHDPDFRQSERDWFAFVEKLTEKLIEIDDTVPELPVKDVVFRIYRDIRFSPDPTPYKAHFSAAWSRTGRKGAYAHYYVQIAPHGKSFVGGGLWHPEAAPIAALRTDIDSRPRKIKDVLSNDRLRKELLKGVPKDDKKVVKAFVASPMNAESALKTKPKGYTAEHPDIELLRLRNYTLGAGLSDEEVTSPKLLDRIGELLLAVKPFITYLNSVVMPDEDAEEESGDDDDEEGSEAGSSSGEGEDDGQET